jgi:hypothetical protein
MFPIGDDNTQERTVPVVTYALIALNVLFFLVELSGGDQFIKDWAFIPARFSADPASNAVTILTSMFMHGSWMHLFGNMFFCGSSEITSRIVSAIFNSWPFICLWDSPRPSPSLFSPHTQAYLT